MSSDAELFVTEHLGDDLGARTVIGGVLGDLGVTDTWQFDHLGSNLTDYKKNWPEHVRVPVEFVGGNRFATLHAMLSFEVRDGWGGQYIDPVVDDVWVTVEWEAVLDRAERDDEAWVEQVRETYDVDGETVPVSD